MTIGELLESFRIYKQTIDGRSDSTLELYLQHIRSFLKDMEINDYDALIHTKASQIVDWLVKLHDQGNGATTRNNKLSAVKQLFEYLLDVKEEDIDMKVIRFKPAKTPIRQTKFFNDSCIQSMLHESQNQREIALLTLLYYSCIRISELRQITCTNIRDGWCTVIGKGNKERKLFFNKRIQDECVAYIEGRRAKMVKKYGITSDILFISKKGNPITRQEVTQILIRMAERAGIVDYQKMTPHKIRHSGLTRLSDSGATPSVVKDIAGHASLATTSLYIHTNEEKIRKAMETL